MALYGMETESKNTYIFTTCQVGADPTLKKELQRDYPMLRFAYSRPGFATFKWLAEAGPLEPDFELKSVFARTYGLSLGRLLPSEARVRLAELCAGAQGGKLHVWERDRHVPGEEPAGWPTRPEEREVFRAFLKADVVPELPPGWEFNTPARTGERVVDLVLVEAEEWWLGTHIHSAAHSPYVGGMPQIELPVDAPSRAYIKMEEALLWSQAPIQAGDCAVELGSAPGGACFSLLQRGLKVVGIDPAVMDPKVLKHPGYTHISKPVATVWREELPPSVEWLILDMNVTPDVGLRAVERLYYRMQESLLGFILTIKLNQWKIAEELPHMIGWVKDMGMSRVRVKQLASNRQEVCFFALTKKGLRRRSVTGGSV